MLRDDELPPLPAPDFKLKWVDGSEYKVTKPNIGDTDVFTAEQMHEYGRAVEQAAYAAAIKACEEVKCEDTGTAGDEAYNEAVIDCQCAIESLMTQEQPK